MSVIDFIGERERRETALWNDYVSARELADRTQNIEHGRVAARAWGAWIELFLTPAQSAFMGSTVTKFERRA